MECPNCHNRLKATEVPSRFGQKVDFFKCSKCSSFWFGQFKLYAFPVEEAEKNDSSEKIEVAEHLNCPEDKTPLKEFKDPNVPPEFVAFRCPTCGGMFLPKSQLLFYKKYQMGNKSYMDMSRKTAIALVILFTLMFSSLAMLSVSEPIIRADSYLATITSIWNLRTASLVIAFLAMIVIIIIIASFYKRKKS